MAQYGFIRAGQVKLNRASETTTSGAFLFKILMTYQEKLKDQLWLDKRKHIVTLDKFKCRICGAKDTLQVHHLAYIQGAAPWQYPDEMLITLCQACHHEEEKFKKLIGILIPEITSTGISCKDIYDHLAKLIKKNGPSQ